MQDYEEVQSPATILPESLHRARHVDRDVQAAEDELAALLLMRLIFVRVPFTHQMVVHSPSLFNIALSQGTVERSQDAFLGCCLGLVGLDGPLLGLLPPSSS